MSLLRFNFASGKIRILSVDQNKCCALISTITETSRTRASLKHDKIEENAAQIEWTCETWSERTYTNHTLDILEHAFRSLFSTKKSSNSVRKSEPNQAKAQHMRFERFIEIVSSVLLVLKPNTTMKNFQLHENNGLLPKYAKCVCLSCNPKHLCSIPTHWYGTRSIFSFAFSFFDYTDLYLWGKWNFAVCSRSRKN